MKAPALVVCFLAVVPVAASAQTCKVLDPELQGSYAGPCKDGLAEGAGHAQGAAEYHGEFRAGKKHGRGVKSWPSGDRYAGEFAEDRREGRGKYTWGSGPWAGESYEGSYLADQRHGEGTYRFSSGDIYKGPWAGDRIAGPPTPMMIARHKFEEEAKKAVGVEGQKVCRQMQVGNVPGEWIRGTVVGVSGDQVGIRVDDPGAHRHAIAGVELWKGDVVWDSPMAWTPCL